MILFMTKFGQKCMVMDLYFIVLLFMASYYVNKSQSADLEAQYKLVEHFLTVKNLDSAVLYTCWSITDRIKSMKTLNEKKIAITHRNKEDFIDNYYRLSDLFAVSLYSPYMGLVVDWSCNDDISFKFLKNWLWNANYHWLMMMKNQSNNNIQSFLTSKNINLTINSEVLIVYPHEMDDIFTIWRIHDVYRTAFAPRGKFMIDAVNETFRRWGNRSWKFDKRLNLENLTLDVVSIGDPYGNSSKENDTVLKVSPENLIKYFRNLTLDHVGYGAKYSFAIMDTLTRHILNLTMNVKTTSSWGYKINNKWDGIVGMLLSEDADFSITINAVTPERLSFLDYSALTSWRHHMVYLQTKHKFSTFFGPCFIYRRPRLSSTSTNIFIRPFEITVWIYLIGVILMFGLVYFTIVRFESNNISVFKTLSDIFLLKIGALCQQGTAMAPTKLCNRLIIFLVFVFGLIVYQFYSSSIVSGLLRPTLMTIDSIQKLEESGLDVGIEDVNYITRLVEVFKEIDPYIKKIVNSKVKPKSEYHVPKEGVKKIKKGYYAFLTDPATAYWLINEIFTEREKCDLTELPLSRPQTTGFLVQKNSPSIKLMETRLMNRENQLWHAEKPKCIVGKTVTENDLVSVEMKDIISLLVFMFISCFVSFIILTLKIIIHRYNEENLTMYIDTAS